MEGREGREGLETMEVCPSPRPSPKGSGRISGLESAPSPKRRGEKQIAPNNPLSQRAWENIRTRISPLSQKGEGKSDSLQTIPSPLRERVRERGEIRR